MAKIDAMTLLMDGPEAALQEVQSVQRPAPHVIPYGQTATEQKRAAQKPKRPPARTQRPKPRPRAQQRVTPPPAATSPPPPMPTRQPEAGAFLSQPETLAPSMGETLPPAVSENIPAQNPQDAGPMPDALELMFGDGPKAAEPAQAATPPAKPPAKAAEGEPGWMGSLYNWATGADRDPEYADVGDFDTNELLPDFDSLPTNDRARFDEAMTPYRSARFAMLGNATDEQLADVLELQLGDRFIDRKKDKDGRDIIEYVGRDGKKARAYVNQPGINMDDAGRFAEGALPYIAGGLGANSLLRNTGMFTQALGQAGAAGVTSLGGDAANMAVGSKQGVDPFKALVTAGFAGAAQLTAPAIGFLFRRLVKEPQLYNSATGQLTEKGAKLAKEAGFEPSDMTRELTKAFAKQAAKGNAKQLDEFSRGIQAEEWGIPTTRAERSLKKDELFDESVMQHGGYGKGARDVIDDFKTARTEQVREAALGNDLSVVHGYPMARRLDSMDSLGGARDQTTLGETIQTGLDEAWQAGRKLETAAWDEVTDLLPTADAVQGLRGVVLNARSTTGISISDQTPVARTMVGKLQNYMDAVTGLEDDAAKAAEKSLLDLAQGVPRAVDAMRRDLTTTLAAADSPADKRLAGEIYDQFNRWIQDSARQGLLQGDPQAAQLMSKAVGISREVRQSFMPKGNSEASNGARRILRSILDEADSPERVVQRLFGASGEGVPQTGQREALKHIKDALDKYADKETAARTWDAIRVARWVQIATKKTGEMRDPGNVASRIRTAMNSQRTLMDQLYSPAEQRMMLRFAQAMQTISPPPVNASGSAISGAAAARRGAMGWMLRMTGPFREIAETLLTYSGLPDAAGTVAARTATRQAVESAPVRAINPMIGGQVAPGGNVWMPPPQGGDGRQR